jgi:hypothetical protein
MEAKPSTITADATKTEMNCFMVDAPAGNAKSSQLMNDGSNAADYRQLGQKCNSWAKSLQLAVSSYSIVVATLHRSLLAPTG